MEFPPNYINAVIEELVGNYRCDKNTAQRLFFKHSSIVRWSQRFFPGAKLQETQCFYIARNIAEIEQIKYTGEKDRLEETAEKIKQFRKEVPSETANI